MSRAFYSEYVRHCLRFYARNLDISHFNTKVDKDNWYSCDSVIKRCSDRDRDIIIAVYGNFDTLADNVYEAAQKHNIPQEIIWDMMKDIERKIAKKRELI